MRQRSVSIPDLYEYAILREGGRRATNEDCALLLDITSASVNYVLAVVADGIGGLDMGEYASSHVSTALRNAFTEYTRKYAAPKLSSLKSLILRTLYKCHRQLSEYGAANGIRLGTTASILCIRGRKGLYIHTGDSRLYGIRPTYPPVHSSLYKSVRLYGHDHADSNGRLLSCIGTGNMIRPDVIPLHISNHETLLLCTDGFYKRGEYRFPDIGSLNIAAYDNTLSGTLNSIYRYNLSMGENDNQTAIAIRRSRHTDI